MEENNPSDSTDPNYQPEGDTPPPENAPEPTPEVPTPAPDYSAEIDRTQSEVNTLRDNLKKARSEIRVVKTMLYAGVIMVLVLMFYLINKTHNLEIQDMGTELMLLQNQASLNLGIGQKTLADQVTDLKREIEELKKRKSGTDHNALLTQLEETVVGLNGSLDAVAPNNSAVQRKANLIRRETEDLVETYRETITPPAN